MGELVELEGWWERGSEQFPPDALFDEQFACSGQDFKLCKGMDKGAGMRRSNYVDLYDVRSKGKGKPAVGGSGKAGKGEPAVGEHDLVQQGHARRVRLTLELTKGQYIEEMRLPFNSTVLRVIADGTWHCRRGTCMSLAHLFAMIGHGYTAARLYEYYNLLQAPSPPRGSTRGPHQCVIRLPMIATMRRGGTGTQSHSQSPGTPLAVVSMANTRTGVLLLGNVVGHL